MAVQLTLRAAGKVLAWAVDDWTALLALAALSAEPETLEEFFDSLRRYHPRHCLDESGREVALDDALNSDQPSCLIDLDSQSVLAAGEFELPHRIEVYDADENDRPQGIPCAWLNLADDWLLEMAGPDWLTVINDRARARSIDQRIDTRAVLFGRPMLEFLANQILAADIPGTDDNQTRHARIRAIHAQWLMTSRSDLLGCTPREMLLRKRSHIDLELQFRSQQWSMQGFAPPALGKDAAAYRFGGYGTVEIVTYFDLMRSLLQFAWEQTREHSSVGRRLDKDQLVQRLATYRDAFLNAPPDDDGSQTTCRELIESERRRVPITADGSHLDCDCPICQAMADGSIGGSPAFLFFDGHHLELEDEFAFSLTASREEWDQDQQDLRYLGELPDDDPAEDEPGDDHSESAWTSTFVDWEKVLGPGGSPQVAKLAIGFQLAEVVSELQRHQRSQPSIDALNAAFSRFQKAGDRIVEQSAAQELRDNLEQVASSHADLIPRCADLQSCLDEVLRSRA